MTICVKNGLITVTPTQIKKPMSQSGLLSDKERPTGDTTDILNPKKTHPWWIKMKQSDEHSYAPLVRIIKAIGKVVRHALLRTTGCCSCYVADDPLLAVLLADVPSQDKTIKPLHSSPNPDSNTQTNTKINSLRSAG
jgi:hypothetical protein